VDRRRRPWMIAAWALVLMAAPVLGAAGIDPQTRTVTSGPFVIQARGIALFHLPPRSPKLHGSLECANRTHTEGFYEVTDAGPELESLQAGLADWEVCYNTIRPHQALGYLTPAEYLASLGVEV